jgi:N4-(beta-N-acetylglucosaminyl)-L-asparaginase
MMRFLPCYQAIESLRRGLTPQEAAEDAVRRMMDKFPEVSSGLVVVDKEGRHGGAASGWGGTFTYSFRGGDMADAEVVSVPNLKPREREL